MTFNSIIRGLAKRAGELSAMPDEELRAGPMLDHGSFPVDLSGTRAEAIEKRLIAEHCLADDFTIPDNPYLPWEKT